MYKVTLFLLRIDSLLEYTVYYCQTIARIEVNYNRGPSYSLLLFQLTDTPGLTMPCTTAIGNLARITISPKLLINTDVPAAYQS